MNARGVQIYRGWWIVFTGYLTQMWTGGASGWVFGVLILPMQAELGWSRSTIVGVLTIARLVDGFCGAALGPKIDRHGARLVMTASCLVGGACLIGISQVQAPWQSYALWAIFGLTMPGLMTIGPIVAISNWFVRKRTQAIMFYTFGGATAGTVLVPAMAALSGATSWRTVWMFMAAMLWLLAPLAWTIIRHRPEDVGLQADGDAGLDTPVATAGAGINERAHEAESYWTVSKALHSRSFWLLTFGIMLTTLPASSIYVHMSAFVQSRGFSLEASAAAVSIYGMGAMAGRFVWGYTVGRFGLHKSLVAWGCFYGTSILLYCLPTSLWAIYACTILLGISVAGSQQLRAQSFPDYFGRRIVGSLLGYAGVVATIASASAPLIAAVAYDKTGSYVATFVFFGVCCLVAGFGFIFSKPRRPASTVQQAAGVT